MADDVNIPDADEPAVPPAARDAVENAHADPVPHESRTEVPPPQEEETPDEATPDAVVSSSADDVDDMDDSDVEDDGGDSEDEVSQTAEAVPDRQKRWYVVRVQSGREDTIKEAIERRVRKEGLEEYFGQIVIPVEKVTEVKADKHGKKVTRTRERKLYPGYLMVEVEYNDRILYLFRETSGVGDFVGTQPGNLQREPTPMSEREVQRMLGPAQKGAEEGGKETADRPNPPPKWLDVGDRVRVVDGTFNGMEGTVKEILDAVGHVRVEVTIFGRPVPVELEYYQVEEV